MSSNQLASRSLILIAIFCLLPLSCNFGTTLTEEETERIPEFTDEINTPDNIQTEITEPAIPATEIFPVFLRLEDIGLLCDARNLFIGRYLWRDVNVGGSVWYCKDLTFHRTETK